MFKKDWSNFAIFHYYLHVEWEVLYTNTEIHTHDTYVEMYNDRDQFLVWLLSRLKTMAHERVCVCCVFFEKESCCKGGVVVRERTWCRTTDWLIDTFFLLECTTRLMPVSEHLQQQHTKQAKKEISTHCRIVFRWFVEFISGSISYVVRVDV